MKTQKDVIRTVYSIYRCLGNVANLIHEVTMRDEVKASKQLDAKLMYHAGRLLARLSEDCFLVSKELSAIEGATDLPEQSACDFTSSGLPLTT